MDLYVYSDESGTFDAKHNEFFIFAGVVCLGDQQRQRWSRNYAHVERIVKESKGMEAALEMKASRLSNKAKGKVYRSLKLCLRFAVIIDQGMLNPTIFENKYHKQRYLDFAYKLVLKKYFKHLKEKGYLHDVGRIHVYCDEHITCTDGIYELRESLLSEFKHGTFNSTYERFFPPIFENLQDVEVRFCDSKLVYLVRAADIIANHFFHRVLIEGGYVESERNAFILHLPSNRILSYGDDLFLEPSMLSLALASTA